MKRVIKIFRTIILILSMISLNYFASAQNVGIITTTPVSNLEVCNGVLTITNTLTSANFVLNKANTVPGASNQISFQDKGIYKWALGGTNIGSAGSDNFSFYNYTLGLNSLTILNSNNNVGIGTTSPGSTLEVAGQLTITGGSPGAGKVLTSDANGLATWQIHSNQTTHFIGQSYGGGIVFYVYDNGQHGLIAATVEQVIRWYGGTNTNTRALADGIGAGLKNTGIIIANQGPVDGNAFAATVCNEYSVTVAGGPTYGDWYLPSKYELNLLYLQKTVVGGFAFPTYWSSTELNANYAWSQTFDNGDQGTGVKSQFAAVRPVRAF